MQQLDIIQHHRQHLMAPAHPKAAHLQVQMPTKDIQTYFKWPNTAAEPSTNENFFAQATLNVPLLS